jgi:hypothetical protein
MSCFNFSQLCHQLNSPIDRVLLLWSQGVKLFLKRFRNKVIRRHGWISLHGRTEIENNGRKRFIASANRGRFAWQIVEHFFY